VDSEIIGHNLQKQGQVKKTGREKGKKAGQEGPDKKEENTNKIV